MYTIQSISLPCSEVRLNEALENACSNVLEYKVHKDKVKALRYEKSKYHSVCNNKYSLVKFNFPFFPTT